MRSIDDEEKLVEELKDFIDDAPVEESDGKGSDMSRPSKRKKSDDFDDRLEDEDYDLIEENLGVKVKRVSFTQKKVVLFFCCHEFVKKISHHCFVNLHV
jgi:hypothetical protein